MGQTESTEPCVLVVWSGWECSTPHLPANSCFHNSLTLDSGRGCLFLFQGGKSSSKRRTAVGYKPTSSITPAWIAVTSWTILTTMAPGSSSGSSSPQSASTLSLVLHAGGLVVVYSLYSVLQEKIMKTGYGGSDLFSLVAIVSCTPIRAILASSLAFAGIS